MKANKHMQLAVIGVMGLLSIGFCSQAHSADLPDGTITPGVAETTDLSLLCKVGYTSTVRNVSEALKNKVYSEYTIVTHKPHEYEIDHLISLELGGANDQENLWPQSYITCPWNAHVKDRLENYLHARVCAGELPIQFVQQEISKDWIALYQKLLGDPPVCTTDKKEPASN